MPTVALQAPGCGSCRSRNARSKHQVLLWSVGVVHGGAATTGRSEWLAAAGADRYGVSAGLSPAPARTRLTRRSDWGLAWTVDRPGATDGSCRVANPPFDLRPTKKNGALDSRHKTLGAATRAGLQFSKYVLTRLSAVVNRCIVRRLPNTIAPMTRSAEIRPERGERNQAAAGLEAVGPAVGAPRNAAPQTEQTD